LIEARSKALQWSFESRLAEGSAEILICSVEVYAEDRWRIGGARSGTELAWLSLDIEAARPQVGDDDIGCVSV
jgi:hypothetical protein